MKNDEFLLKNDELRWKNVGFIIKGGGWCLARIERWVFVLFYAALCCVLYCFYAKTDEIDRGISVLSGLGFIALGIGEVFYNRT